MTLFKALKDELLQKDETIIDIGRKFEISEVGTLYLSI